MPDRLRIIVTGLIAQHPQLGGVTWDYLHYPVGLKSLGHDVFYFEDSGQWPYRTDLPDGSGDWAVRDPAPNLQHLASVMDRFGMRDRWAYHFPLDDSWHGMSEARRREIVATADLVVNVSGTLQHPSQYRGSGRLAYIDSDPVFTQIQILQKQGRRHQLVDDHDVLFTFGEDFSSATPQSNHHWLPTRQPMLLDHWQVRDSYRESYTTVMNWTSYAPVEFGGRCYGQKDAEFARFIELPQRVAPLNLEVALAKIQHAKWAGPPDRATAFSALRTANPDASPSTLLALAGWHVADPDKVCGGLDSYRDYIASSKGEWSVAKHGYVQGDAGWFSCRSACYLASGRPAIVQDTGFSRVIPTGEGVLTFRTVEEAAAALLEVEADYPRHSRAAREIAEEYFASDKVLAALIDHASASQPRTAATATA